MATSFIKSIAVGVLIGATLFFAPGFIIGLIITFSLFRLMIGRKMRSGKFQQYRFAFADKVRSMTDEEYVNFKQKASEQHGNCSSRSCC